MACGCTKKNTKQTSKSISTKKTVQMNKSVRTGARRRVVRGMSHYL